MAVDLTVEQRASLQAWLSDRYEEMRPDAKSIREEDPHLIPAIRALLKALKKEPPLPELPPPAGQKEPHAR